MTTDAYIQVATDGTGKKVDNSQLTNDAGDTTYRQRTSIGDPANANALANVTLDGALWVGGPPLQDLLTAIVVELRVCSNYLQQIANSRDSPEVLRADPSNQP